jgi:hypothetical protein
VLFVCGILNSYLAVMSSDWTSLVESFKLTFPISKAWEVTSLRAQLVTIVANLATKARGPLGCGEIECGPCVHASYR